MRMSLKVYDYEDYRDLLKAVISELHEVRGLQSRLAEAAGCQRSYFSQVLKGNSSLTLEQGIGIANYLLWDELQTMYFLELINREKAGSPALRDHFTARIKDIRKKSKELGGKLGEKRSLESTEAARKYYSSWSYSAVHILVGIDGFQTLTAVSERLSLSASTVAQILADLEKMELVKKVSAQRWKLAEGSLHLGRDSSMTFSNHGNWRQQALFDVSKNKDSSIHYTAVQSLSKKDVEVFKEFVLEMIEKSRNIVRKSGAEEITCFTCDFFEV